MVNAMGRGGGYHIVDYPDRVRHGGGLEARGREAAD